MKVIKLNSKKEPLTVKKLRQYKGLENLTETEATHIIDTLRRLAKLTFCYYGKLKEQEEQIQAA